MTNLSEELLSIADLYRQRADAENVYDELKNQWGWGGFMTKDKLRCQVAARNGALIYNWWSLFVRCAESHRPREAVTSRPLLLCAVGRGGGERPPDRVAPDQHARPSRARADIVDEPEPVPERTQKHCGAVESEPVLGTDMGQNIDSVTHPKSRPARSQRGNHGPPGERTDKIRPNGVTQNRHADGPRLLPPFLG